ncbi:MAG: metallophosphoesterase, partial [Aeromonas sp.]
MHFTLKLSAVAVLLALSGCQSSDDSTPGDVNLRLMETSDIHSNLLSFDYYQNKRDDSLGLARTALLIKTARDENSNNLLIDNGDLIQGTPLSDYVFAQYKGDPDYLNKSAGHPAIKVLNELKYDVGNLGNHEFNYGLEYLAKTLSAANYQVVNANVF